jgi:nucleotide-binding universal stress UspA family protein
VGQLEAQAFNREVPTMRLTYSPTSMPGTATAPRPLAQSYDPPVRGPVLAATDGREGSEAVLQTARAVAERLGTTVDVVGVLEPVPSYYAAPEVPVVPPDVEDARRAAMLAAIGERMAAVGGDFARWPVFVGHGEPGRTIAASARERDSSLIVVGAGRPERRDLCRVRGADANGRGRQRRRALKYLAAVDAAARGGFRIGQ